MDAVESFRSTTFARYWLSTEIAALSRSNIVVTTEIKRSRASSGRRKYARTFTSHVIEAEPVQIVEENAGAFLIVIPWWILRWNRNQPLRKIQHRWLGETFAQSGSKLLSI
jgi:hypothetical protein